MMRGGAMRRMRMMRMMRMMRRRRRRRRRRLLLLGGMVAIGVHHHRKISKQNAQRIEDESGVPVEDMTDEELDQAMSDLNIQGEELTEEERSQVEQDDDEGEEEQLTYLDELERLAQLRDDGIITEEEFAAKKKQLLDL